MEQVQLILDYWFGEIKDGTTVEDKNSLWWMGGPEVDSEIKDIFGTLVAQAKNKELDSWRNAPESRLALLILLDQFSRNIYRGTAEAFASDSYARDIAREGVANGHDKKLAYIQRVFFYLPFEHSEDLVDHEECVRLMTELGKEYGKDETFLKFALDHKKIIEQFGRYPHRNKALGRTNTPEEDAYLAGEHNSYGQ